MLPVNTHIASELGDHDPLLSIRLQPRMYLDMLYTGNSPVPEPDHRYLNVHAVWRVEYVTGHGPYGGARISMDMKDQDRLSFGSSRSISEEGQLIRRLDIGITHWAGELIIKELLSPVHRTQRAVNREFYVQLRYGTTLGDLIRPAISSGMDMFWFQPFEGSWVGCTDFLLQHFYVLWKNETIISPPQDFYTRIARMWVSRRYYEYVPVPMGEWIPTGPRGQSPRYVRQLDHYMPYGEAYMRSNSLIPNPVVTSRYKGVLYYSETELPVPQAIRRTLPYWPPNEVV
ncbi:hypothetical protein ACG7TL_004379 [Trametes sanguinea]